ncbi:glycosyltransferase family 2 protein [Rheinheimera maricola]|uniref:Glycosyltransferase family 2 protein n=1 Tax=Rheinheimera maricola TaxID=2793282 RepID=A0ABS7X6N3_9GAMM|nr:glycosyltransferase family 2 protein [Rheinheimera maricola]MBZ9610363.1 glycosyltransferase family 2 protein [Rheinheimera maricola]
MQVVALTTAEVVALTPKQQRRDDGWSIAEDRIVVPLKVAGPGWYSIEGEVVIEGRKRIVSVHSAAGLLVHLPLTLKGRLLDLFYVPAGYSGLSMQISAKDLTLYRCDFQLTKLTTMQRVWRMTRRLALTFIRQPASRRRGVALGWTSVFEGLEPAYRKACQLRAWHAGIPYAAWIRLHEAEHAQPHSRIAQYLTTRPRLVVVVYGDATLSAALWQTSIDSVAKAKIALSNVFALTINTGLNVDIPTSVACGDAKALAKWLAVDGRVLLLRAGAVLSAWSGAWWALCGTSAPFSYSDSDYLMPHRRRPQFKPDWSIELLRSTHYIGDVVCCQVPALLNCGWLESDWQRDRPGQRLVLRLAEQLDGASAPEHIAAVLWHDTLPPAPAQPASVAEHLQRLGVAAAVSEGAHQTVRVSYQRSSTPLVSIIVPTRDMLNLLAACVNSVLDKTQYPSFELLIVDNQSSCSDTLAYMQQITADARVKVLCYDQPFNYAAINNFAVNHADGELICLLNNDTEVISAQWLDEMVATLQQPAVGAVGARLLYSDGRVQHAGDTVGPGGCADHLHSKIARHEAGYMKRAVATQEVSAVTAACLLTPKPLFLQLGGLNEQQLAVAFNDVDYCLRVREAGYRVVYNAYAELYHHESVSRGKDSTPEKAQRAKREAEYMRRRWAHLMSHDPFYNPNLNYQRADFSLGRELKVKAPWQ